MDRYVDVNRYFVSRIIAALLLGGLFGWHMHRDYVAWGLRGREAFIAYELHRFDDFVVNPRPVMYHVVAMVLLAFGVFAVYEAIAYGLATVAKGILSDKS